MHVAVLGAGYAGLSTARRLESRLPPEVDLTVVNDGPDHVLVHEVHRAVRRPAVADAITIPLSDVLDRATVVDARVESVDAEAGRADLDAGETLSWEYGALCLGSETAYYGIDGLSERATPLKSLSDAAAIRERFLALCDAGGGQVVVGGAGLSGVQVAGELTALAEERGLAVPDDIEVVLVEQLEEVAPNFPANFRRAVREELTDRGVDVRTGTTVERVTDGGVETDAGPLAYDQLVWTGGITGDDATGGDRPTVRADLRLTDRTFALGDAARAVDADGEPVPASASAAIRMGKTAAENVGRLVDHELNGSADEFDPRLERYRFDVPGWLVSVGDGAVAQIGPTVLRGTAARASKTTVGAGYLTSVGAVHNAVNLAEEELL
ncbi:NAD(P)/FAD-dependent oxidoreductase [Candidatus Halobonum tyrrellensis]|uniref:NADH dehydrogenase n=1 Tax=Candidatus Halobonum tyrrellensis G22 TaxID=1324957 RepID=V4HCV8_9EURY|nr:FAD-dependent oxidoreductase [Candidatus Halobonum tyrrellensis]ESP88550.1 NADH dehydrogenase [Candidatus Halobonum tyrrellensis G22]